MNNFDIKQERHGIFVLLYATDTKQDLGKPRLTKQPILVKMQAFFVKTELRHIKLQLVNNFVLFLLIFFSEIIRP